jgi:arginine N-succinyltransferase
MKVVRAIRKDDLDGLMYLATQVGGGMTTLKPDKKMLSKRIAVACDSFAEKNPPEQRDYLFVLEETENENIIGVCAIKSTVGLEEPFYNYRIGTLVHASRELNVYSRMQTLYLSNDLTGCSELCSLFLHPDYRTGTNGKLLSKSRLLFIAQFPHLFSEKLIAELRGYQRPDGSSPFWDSLGRHFFQMDFSRADALVSSSGKKSFIADLMPRHPLYTAYLPKEAQEAIGNVHVDTEPARKLLEEEGFFYEGYIDIFDAGPVMLARVSKLRSSRLSELVEVVGATKRKVSLNKDSTKEPTLVANTSMLDYRIILSEVAPENGKLPLTTEQQQVMSCSTHSHVRVMSLMP